MRNLAVFISESIATFLTVIYGIIEVFQESELLRQPLKLCVLRDVAAKNESVSVVLFFEFPLLKALLEVTSCCCEKACSGPETQLLLENVK